MRERLAAHGLDESAVNTRLNSFQLQTGALFKALEERCLLRRVDASASPDATLASAAQQVFERMQPTAWALEGSAMGAEAEAGGGEVAWEVLDERVNMVPVGGVYNNGAPFLVAASAQGAYTHYRLRITETNHPGGDRLASALLSEVRLFADPDREVDPASFRVAASFAVQKRLGWQTFPLEAQSRYVRLVVHQNHAFAGTARGAHASVRINEIEVLEA